MLIVHVAGWGFDDSDIDIVVGTFIDNASHA
jgi:hypothetical protein